MSKLLVAIYRVSSTFGKDCTTDVFIYVRIFKDIPASPYHLEELIDKIEEEKCSILKLNLLTATMKLFLKRPPECQNALGRLLQYCIGMYPQSKNLVK